MIAHDVLTFLCAKQTLPEDRLEITPYRYEKLDKSVYNPKARIEMRGGKRPSVAHDDPMIDEDRYYADFVTYHSPNSNTTDLYETIALYSAEPDWGMDEDIKVSPFQFLTGGSQGYRHLRYALFGVRAGAAHKRAAHFTRLAELAFTGGDRYWGVRFSACAIHYIEDLLTPLHQKPCTEGFYLKALLAWKRMGGIVTVAFNYHHSFERYTGYHLWHGTKWLIDAILRAQRIDIQDLKKDLNVFWKKAKKLTCRIFREWREFLKERMEHGKNLLGPEEVAVLNPTDSLKRLLEEWLELAAGLVKGYLARYVAPYLGEDRL
jgi:hypothetical protein